MGLSDRAELKQRAKAIFRENRPVCLIAGGVAALSLVLIVMIYARLSSGIPDFLGVTTAEDFAARLMAEPVAYGLQLLKYYSYLFGYLLLATLVGLILRSPFLLSQRSVFYRMSNGETPKPGELFRWYGALELSGRACLVTLIAELIKIALFALTCLLPLALYIFLLVEDLAGVLVMPGISSLLPLVSLVGIGFTAVRYLRGWAGAYILAKNPELRPVEAVRRAKALLKGGGRTKRLFGLVLSFILWFALAVFTWGVVLIYALPVLELSVTLFMQRLEAEEAGQEQ